MERLGVSGQFEGICDIHALDYIYPKPMPEAYERFANAHRRRAARARRCSTICRIISRPRTRSA